MISRRNILTGGITSIILASIPKRLFADKKKFDEYCFRIKPDLSMGVREITTTPEKFLQNNENVQAAINGPYFGLDNKTEGIVFLADNNYFGTRKPEHIRGYFTINKNGNKVQVNEKLPKDFSNYWLVIGTHPILVSNEEINSQARENRYNKIGLRSAIGTKDEKDICFAVSREELSMLDWANELKVAGYNGAINLDGGPFSKLSIRDNKSIKKLGKGNQETKLIIFSYYKK